MIAASAFFSAVVAQLLLAPLADGAYKILMAGAIVIAALGYCGSLWLISLGALNLRVLNGLGIGAFAPAAPALVASRYESAGERLGRLTAVETSGFVAGPLSEPLSMKSGG
ncbi:MAG: hypothetical protein CM15mP49_33060 [Actinomycetota bacterium]|nr:MAG: hypothetical protein CM15mP49_33060 [Actinomycetota bacterium]